MLVVCAGLEKGEKFSGLVVDEPVPIPTIRPRCPLWYHPERPKGKETDVSAPREAIVLEWRKVKSDLAPNSNGADELELENKSLGDGRREVMVMPRTFFPKHG